MKTVRLVITSEAEVRLDLALLSELQKEAPLLSRAQLKNWFKSDQVILNGRAAQPSTLLRAGTHEVQLKRWDESATRAREARAAAEGAFLPVVYEDDELLVLHKLTGIPSVPQENDESHTAVGAALAYRPELKNIGRGGFEPGILHRLDTGTSGLLVFAKTDTEFDRLRALWKGGHVRKTYRALTRGAPEQPRPHTPVKIDYPIGHDPKSSKKMIAMVPGREFETRGEPLPAVTWIREFREIASGLFDAEIGIETGVMHQIRCHMASIGWPLLGDAIYKGVPSARLWLHAWRLEIPLATGATLRLEAALPETWKRK